MFFWAKCLTHGDEVKPRGHLEPTATLGGRTCYKLNTSSEEGNEATRSRNTSLKRQRERCLGRKRLTAVVW
ncbi:hypothetical protein EYF80_023738 [Liparis tanakae]|uniref:Uncharacterized protein n=1 Tax=Liparis tanakae TaxID=230148 RepID=A0A4Z2HMG7_9TELE|nr:hypothetical protein EYF80_023738 [Liparis tanakae]